MSMTNKFASGYESVTTGYRFFLLFLFLLAVLILYPYADTTRSGFYALRVLGSAVIVVSVFAIRLRRSVLIFALILAVPALVQRLRLPEPTASTFSILNIILSFTFDIFVVVVIFRRVFAHQQTDSETVFGALCIYLLVGFIFASIYGMIAVLQPQAFYLDPHTNLHTVPNRFDFIYYSFGTMTSLGAAGITPISSEARSLTVVEAILGVLYLAVLVARLIGAYRSTPGQDL
ncbi:MAG: ion channel [Candidatus Acidiferrales bacterium]